MLIIIAYTDIVSLEQVNFNRIINAGTVLVDVFLEQIHE